MSMIGSIGFIDPSGLPRDNFAGGEKTGKTGWVKFWLVNIGQTICHFKIPPCSELNLYIQKICRVILQGDHNGL
jgi:hypothetical protein